MKKRIFLTNDASFLNTGYGIYGKEILTRLYNSDKYEVAELGCYAHKDNPLIKSIPWKFYPNTVSGDDARAAQYRSNALNQFGLWRFNRCIADFKPHIVFDVRDYWMFSYQEASPLKKYFSWVIMPATDSAPPKIEWLHTFANADVVVPYTEWAKKTLSASCGNQINLFPKIANAGINPTEFYPISDKTAHKVKYLGQDYKVIGAVMRNQKRKLLPDLMLAFRKYLELLKQQNNPQADNTILYLHTSFPETSGWDIPALLLEYGIANKTYFTYHCKNCKKCFPSKFHQGLTVCNNCNTKAACVASPVNGIATEELNNVYNLFDIFVQYAICEGFGMPQVEAAACGIQLASVDYSAMTEISENLNGYKIPLSRIFREMETNADRVYPDIDKTVEIFNHFFNTLSDAERQANSSVIREKCLETYTWDNVYKVWEECFDSIDINSKIPWDATHYSTPKHSSIKVPKGLSDKEFIQYICCNIINENDLLSTAPIQTLIRETVSGITANNESISIINRQHLVEKLEAFLNNKMSCEQMRMQLSPNLKEDFI